MSSPKDHRKGRVPKKEGLKGLDVLRKECAVPATVGLEVYPSSVDGEDLSPIWLAYMSDVFDLELLSPSTRVDEAPLAI